MARWYSDVGGRTQRTTNLKQPCLIRGKVFVIARMRSTVCRVPQPVILQWKSEMEVDLEWKSEMEVRNKTMEMEDPSQPPYDSIRFLLWIVCILYSGYGKLKPRAAQRVPNEN